MATSERRRGHGRAMLASLAAALVALLSGFGALAQLPADNESDTVGEVLDALQRRRETFVLKLAGGRIGEEEQLETDSGPRQDAAIVSSRYSPQSLLLGYWMGDHAVQLAVVAGSGVRPASLVRLELSVADLSSQVEEVNRLMRGRSRLGRGRLNRLLDDLGDALLAPAAAQIREAERLIFMTHGPLLELPFAALRVPRSLDRDRPYLIEKITLCFELSLAEPEDGHGTSKPASWRGAAFVEPELRPEGRPLGAALSDGGVSWRSRGANRKEAELVPAIFPGSVLITGSAATSEALLALPEDIDLIHLAVAAHGDADPSAGYLELASGARLTTRQIAQELDSSAELVVLSAHSSAPRGAAGEHGGLAFASAFHRSGADSVLVSLWQASNDATVILFDRIYRALVAGDAAPSALRAAQRELLRAPLSIVGSSGAATELDARDPFFWAGLQLYGSCR